MPRTVELDTPFKKGEKVLATRDLPHVEKGTKGKVKLINGLTTWLRYWVLFDNGEFIGHLDDDDLVRPNQIDAWQERLERRENAALVDSAAASEEAAAAPAGGDGAAGLIPAHLLERSKAAKARKLGG